ncbi:MAG: pyrroline-5-carboxylate reductase [Waddliaceae bacterium]
MKISIIGCGKMGGGIANCLAKDHKLALFDHHQEVTKNLAKKLGAKCCSNAAEAVSHRELIILAVKPRDLDDVAKLIHHEIYKEQLLVSILAGVTTYALQEYFSEIPILRMMPNLALLYGQGVIGLVDDDNLSPEMKQKAQAVFRSMGHLHWIPEKQADALTALTGSGPAFLFVLLESIVDAGIAMGFSSSKAKELALQLFSGVTATVQGSEKHPAELKWEVASPGGTTIAGLKTLEDHAVRSGIINAFLAARQRAKEISKE